MNDERPVVDDKAVVRRHLDLAGAVWKRLRPRDGMLEYAFVTHGDGMPYVVLRSSSEADGTILVFTRSEWDAFLRGARDGEFDLPVSG